MESQPNEVMVPTEGVERALRPFVVKKFTGRVEIPLTIKPEAALYVEVGEPVAYETTRFGQPRPCISPEVFEQGPSERELILVQTFRENANRFRVNVNPKVLICDLKEGRLNVAQWVTRG